MSSYAVRAADLTKTYRGRDVVAALHLSVEPGSITVLIGPNGSGKTTTLEMITTLRSPTSGTIEVFGLNTRTARQQVRRLVGVALQGSALDPLMTPVEALRLQARALGMRAERARSRADEVIDLLALAEAAHQRVGTLSGGNRRRVDLGVALVGDPLLLVLDEPTSGIDPVSRLGLWDELRRLQHDRGTTILLSTQDLHEAEVLATSMVMLRDGREVMTGSPADFRGRVGTRTLRVVGYTEAAADRIERSLHGVQGRSPDNPREVRVRLAPTGSAGDSSDEPWEAVLAGLGQQSADIASIHLDQPSLDDAFLFLARSATVSTSKEAS